MKSTWLILREKKLIQRVTQEVSHPGGERTEKQKTIGISVKLEDNFQNSKVRHSVYLPSSETTITGKNDKKVIYTLWKLS